MRTEWSKAGYKLRLAQKQDAEPYFRNNFNPLDSETARLTGSQKHFELDKVISYIQIISMSFPLIISIILNMVYEQE